MNNDDRTLREQLLDGMADPLWAQILDIPCKGFVLVNAFDDDLEHSNVRVIETDNEVGLLLGGLIRKTLLMGSYKVEPGPR